MILSGDPEHSQRSPNSPFKKGRCRVLETEGFSVKKLHPPSSPFLRRGRRKETSDKHRDPERIPGSQCHTNESLGREKLSLVYGIFLKEGRAWKYKRECATVAI